MTIAARGEEPIYRGNRPRSTTELSQWHAMSTGEAVLEPKLPIVDAHHHIFGKPTDEKFYCLEDLEQDIASGHNIVGTVWLEAYEDGWRTSGPEELRSVGEVEGVLRKISKPVRSAHGLCQVAAGMVSNVNFMVGDRVAEVLDAHIAAAEGRLCGVRHHASYDAGPAGRFAMPAIPHLLADANFRRGFAHLSRSGLCFDALVYHTQLDDVVDLADAFPDVPMVLNHVGQFLGVANYASRREGEFAGWKKSLRDLAARPNVCVKVGGMGMPMFGFGFESGPAPANSGELAQAWKPFIESSIEAFGPQRCMFESNFPVDKQSCTYLALWNAFKLASASYSPDDRRELFYRTACRIYRLPELQATCDKAWLQAF